MAWKLKACTCMRKQHVELMSGNRRVDAIVSIENGVALIDWLSGDRRMALIAGAMTLSIDAGEQLKEELHGFGLPRRTPELDEPEVAQLVDKLAPLKRGCAEGAIEDAVRLRQLSRDQGDWILGLVYAVRNIKLQEMKERV